MTEVIENLLISSGPFAIIVSIIINIIISVAGVIPSLFVTAANITFFGFNTGLIISYIGECAGAAVSFWIYRKGIKTLNPTMLNKNKWLQRLQNTQGWDSFVIILVLRVLPFIPSGMINLAVAISKTSILTFIVASSLGKLPALFIEAYSVKQVLESTNEQKVILAIIALFVLFIYLHQKRKKKIN
ncbi:VTT domain-containing protein [Neobacillus sp. YX16]|uniref:TVP38/TMEM64 family protein n=1 Tax=Neobacillus sp. YX16 TaxID=3047874 RepID=UPI0024C22F1B|nr:VTT domain-containing protein [Neobacillus sp. YX16]WHZ00474.1 VTT domain-containing protein [Neobacillus sp. YX16]